MASAADEIQVCLQPKSTQSKNTHGARTGDVAWGRSNSSQMLSTNRWSARGHPAFSVDPPRNLSISVTCLFTLRGSAGIYNRFSAGSGIVRLSSTN